MKINLKDDFVEITQIVGEEGFLIRVYSDGNIFLFEIIYSGERFFKGMKWA